MFPLEFKDIESHSRLSITTLGDPGSGQLALKTGSVIL